MRINCGECGIIQSPSIKEECSIIKCINKECGKETCFIICPKVDCRFINFYKSEEKHKENLDNESNYFNKHQKDKSYYVLNLFNKRIVCGNETCKSIFIKFKCKKCNFINFTFSRDYYQGAEVICQNQNCREVFCNVNCPICNKTINFEKILEKKKNSSKLFSADWITCDNDLCKSIFSKIDCPQCKTEKFSQGKNNFLEGKKLRCDSNDCYIDFSFYNCPNCYEINIWKKKFNDIEMNKKDEIKLCIKNTYTRAQPVKCVNCEITTHKINCPFCYEKILFGDNFCEYGVNYTCCNPKCFENFYINFCPCCFKTKIEKGLRNNLNFLSCPYNKNSEVIKFNTKEVNISSLNNGLKKYCENKYDFIICDQCFGYLFYFEKDFKQNSALKCPKNNCKCIFFIYHCKKCSQRIKLKENSIQEFILGYCSNKSCKEPFKLIYCKKCRFISKTNFESYEEFLQYQKEFKMISPNSKFNPCENCLRIEDNSKDANLFNTENNITLDNPQINIFRKNLLNRDKNNNPFLSNINEFNEYCNKSILFNFYEDEKENIKYNILKLIEFENGIKLNKPFYHLDNFSEKFNKSLKINKSKQVLSSYDEIPLNFESKNFKKLYIFDIKYLFRIFYVDF